MNWMIQVKFAGSIHSGTRKREGDGEREGYLPARKGVGKPLRAVRWQGFDPPARVKPRFQSWRGATLVSWHAVDNEDGRKFGSGPVPLRSGVGLQN